MNAIAMLWMAAIVLTGFGLGAISIWIIEKGVRLWMILTGIGVLLILIAGFLP